MTVESIGSQQIEKQPPTRDTRRCDGIICFGGEDWWYHNRGHFDMQIMRECSNRVPVLYVNSLGMRVPRPSEGAMFVRRVVRKLRSLARGFKSVRASFGVCSPLAIPGTLGMRVTKRLLPRQIRRCARKMGIKRPLIWVACPPGAEVIEKLDGQAIVYQRTDKYEEYDNVDRQQIARYDKVLKQTADMTVFCARLLHEEEHKDCAASVFIDHGVDYERFAAAGTRTNTEPEDLRDIPSPRAGFIGGIDVSTFDPALFLQVAGQMPDVSFVLVGACSLPQGWCDLSNVHLLGQRPYETVASYMAACDVLLMPWNRSEWIRACNPVKLKEYLAVGRPVVSTSFPELAHYKGLIRVADDAEHFVAAIRESLARAHDPHAQQQRVEQETWHTKGQQIVDRLQTMGIELQTGVHC